MHTIASKMKLFKGFEAEYKRRHDEIWPELSSLLRESGILEYQIFLDTESLSLFAILKTEDPLLLENLPAHPIMQKWWQYMKDIMETNADGSPVSIPLQNVYEMK